MPMDDWMFQIGRVFAIVITVTFLLGICSKWPRLPRVTMLAVIGLAWLATDRGLYHFRNWLEPMTPGLKDSFGVIGWERLWNTLPGALTAVVLVAIAFTKPWRPKDPNADQPLGESK